MSAVAESVGAPATRLMADALRMLAIDAVEAAKSGHPGMPLGMAEIAVALWDRHLKHNPRDPAWPDRDRFVLSNGHGSMLLYGLLHLSGYDLPIDELKRFRQLHSKTPGHPEVGVTPGVETTTGPLGQGLANAVGMALAEALLAREFNRPGHAIVDHRTYVFTGDGCLMEGISHEAASLAGTLKLDKLTVLYDDNGISIDGHVQQWFADDTPARFAAYGWHVVRAVDGHDVDAVDRALQDARAAGKPTLICCKTVIGKGSPSKAGTHDVHGAPLGADEIGATRRALGWPHPPFVMPGEVRTLWDASERGAAAQAEWTQRFDAYRRHYPAEAAEFERRTQGTLPAQWRDAVRAMVRDVDCAAESIATRKASQQTIAVLARCPPRVSGRLGRPDRLQSHQLEKRRRRACRRRRPARRQLSALRRARIRHERADERHCAASRACSVRRHVPHVFRLLAQRFAHGLADENARDLRVHARFDRSRRGRADTPGGGTCGEPQTDSGARHLASVRHGRNGAGPGRKRSNATGRRACC